MLRLRLCIKAFISQLIWVYLLRPWGQISKTDTVMRSFSQAGNFFYLQKHIYNDQMYRPDGGAEGSHGNLNLYLQMHLGLLIKQEKETVEMLHFEKNTNI